VSTTAIDVRGLRKSYGDKTVLDGIDLTIPAGSIFSLLGPNGAGKTTTVQILSTLIPADDGELRVAGYDVMREPHAVRTTIGVTGQFAAVDELMTAEENLLLMGDLHHLDRRESTRRANSLLAKLDLGDARGKRAQTFSGGMIRRLDLAMTLLGEPSVIFLDEPTTGLDPRSRRAVWDIIRGLVAEGMTVLLTTQYLEEADELADRIAVLDHGRIVAEGTPDQLKRLVPGGYIRVRFADPGSLDAAASILDGALRSDHDLTLQVPSDGGVGSLRAVLDRLDHGRIPVDGLSVRTPDLDDVFLALTGHTTGTETEAALR
jgi:ABC-2 type transport system ATP-binding protein